MSANLPTSFRLPFALPTDVHPAVKDALRLTYQGVLDLNQAIRALSPQVKNNTTVVQQITNTVNAITGGGGGTPAPAPVFGNVNLQPNLTPGAYTIAQSDFGGLIVVQSVIPFALTLDSGLKIPYFTTVYNLGTGVITATPSTGNVNGVAIVTLALNQGAIFYFDGVNWWAFILPLTSSGPTPAAYDMLQWMLMSQQLRAANHFKSTGLDGVTPANHLYTQLNAGNFFWIKGDSGFPWDINSFDDAYIYLGTTELTYASASEGKRFESLDESIGFKGVPFALRYMNIGDVVLSQDTRLALYTACGVSTYTNIGKAKCTLTGPYIETIPGAGSNLPPNLTTIHLEYEWSLNASYVQKAGTTKETFTLCQPYGLVNWQTQNWNTGTNSYDPPTNATHYNILTPGVTGLPAVDPCGFAVDGSGAWIGSGTSGSLGGSAMTAGQTITASVTVPGANVGMAATCSPQSDPGAGFDWDAFVSASNIVTVRLTCVLAGTPASSVYNVRVAQ